MRSLAGAWIATLCLACAAPRAAPSGVEEWLRASAVPLAKRAEALRSFESAAGDARVVALGEATHGQHEAFELKRELTLHLVRHAGFRVVAFEASSSRARACDDFIAGRSDDLDAAMAGLGMLIWRVEENAELLRDLREWNRSASRDDRVHFIGIDVQDGSAAAARIEQLLGEGGAELGPRLRDWASRIDPAVQKLWSGDASAYMALQDEFKVLESAIDDAAPRPDPELELRKHELHGALSMYHSRGARDRLMAELLLEQLDALGSDSRAVLLAHDAHVSRGPLRSQQVVEPALGGNLAQHLGSRYYALGLAFGEGEFQANARDADGRWGFRTYRISSPPPGSLEEPLARALDADFIVDLRRAPNTGEIAAWLDTPHGQRVFGGYNIRDDIDVTSRDASTLPPTVPRIDFDGLVFVARTRAATPRSANASK